MINSLLEQLKLLPQKFWILIGISFITTPVAIAYLIVNSGSIEWKSGETQVNLKGKQIITKSEADTEKLEEQINKLIKSNQDLTSAAQAKNVAGKLKPQIATAEKAAAETTKVLESATKSNEELKEFVESTIND